MKASTTTLFLSALSFIFISTTIEITAQCTTTQLGGDIRYATSFDDQVGYSSDISTDGSTIVAGAWNGQVGAIRTGKARLYNFNSTTSQWDQKGQELSGTSAQDLFGADVALNSDGNYVIIGAFQASFIPDNFGGYAEVYKYNPMLNMWEIQGQRIEGVNQADAFGTSVDISGDGQTIIIGAPGSDDGGTDAGQASVYEYNSTTNMWEIKGPLITGNVANTGGTGVHVTITNGSSIIGVASQQNSKIFQYNLINDAWDQIGNDLVNAGSQFIPNSIGINSNGTRVAIGSQDLNSFNGGISIFDYNSVDNTWDQVGNSIQGTSDFRSIGAATSMNADGSILITGGTGYRFSPFTDRAKGSALVYQFDTSDSIWNQMIEPIIGTEIDARFGFSVGISGDGLRFISGSTLKDNEGTPTIFDGGQVQVYMIDTSNCDGCSFSTDTTFADITIPCNTKLEPPKILDMCIDSMIYGIPLDSGFYFMQDTFMTQWVFTTADQTMDTALQKIIVDGVALCDTSSSGIGSLRNAFNCAMAGDTIDILANVMNDTLILDGTGLTVQTDVILSVAEGESLTIDASGVASTFTVVNGSSLTLNGIQLIMGTSMDGGVAVNNGVLNILNSILFPNPTNPGGAQFSGNGVINIDPETVIYPEDE